MFATNFLGREVSSKKIVLKESDDSLAKVLATKIKQELNCDVFIVKTQEQLERLFQRSNESFFVGVFEYSSDNPSDLEAIEFALEFSLPTIVITSDEDEPTRQLLGSKNIVDYVPKVSLDDIDYLIRLIRQLFINSETEVLVANSFAKERKEIVSILKNQLFSVYEAKDGEEALASIKKHKDIKLLICDFEMPKIDGLELTAAVRKIKTKDELPIIATSNSMNNLFVSKFLKFGASDYVKKPFSKEEFVCRVNNHIEHLALVEFQKELTNYDYFTGLYNRSYLMGTGRTLHANSVRGNIQFVVGLIDIDNFRQLNYQYGQESGDKVVKDFAARLKAHFRKSDVVCRFGGQEFCVLLTNVGDKYIESTFNKLISSARSAKITAKNRQIIKYTVSIGVCATLMSSFDGMLKVAEERLQEAKKAGKDMLLTDVV